MFNSTQQKPVVITVDQAGFNALVPNQIPESAFVNNSGAKQLWIQSDGALALLITYGP